jgi:hypothetical protein
MPESASFKPSLLLFHHTTVFLTGSTPHLIIKLSELLYVLPASNSTVFSEQSEAKYIVEFRIPPLSGGNYYLY